MRSTERRSPTFRAYARQRIEVERWENVVGRPMYRVTVYGPVWLTRNGRRFLRRRRAYRREET